MFKACGLYGFLLLGSCVDLLYTLFYILWLCQATPPPQPAGLPSQPVCSTRNRKFHCSPAQVGHEANDCRSISCAIKSSCNFARKPLLQNVFFPISLYMYIPAPTANSIVQLVFNGHGIHYQNVTYSKHKPLWFQKHTAGSCRKYVNVFRPIQACLLRTCHDAVHFDQ